ncbi:MAG TPA: patatin-like phospholipase family protein, partial [Crenalkalicoccus sp.]|nr:patatin-like phospholipase family protein [Crenalkalicoccus sp.]
VLGGVPHARFWADTQAPELTAEAFAALDRERAFLAASGMGPALPTANFLAISGGSDNGAFGAGLLCGWTVAGTRPEFKLVTGVSTGALTAPFAFLGPAYDAQLREVYTTIGPDDVLRRRGYLAIPFAEAMTDSDPLFRLISHHMNERMLADIAREYAKGRLLLIGTTDLDVMRPVIWNIGAIAASGQPGALDLVRRILLASTAVPAVFPPVLVDVTLDGRPYQEMHVDGGAVVQLFLYPPGVTAGQDLRSGALARERRAYVLRNARLDPDWAAVERRLFTIAGRAISSMIHYSGNSDILRLETTAARDGVDFNLAYIGPDFTVEHRADFETAYMRALFEYGYAKAVNGYPWQKAHPVLSVPPPARRVEAGAARSRSAEN